LRGVSRGDSQGKRVSAKPWMAVEAVLHCMVGIEATVRVSAKPWLAVGETLRCVEGIEATVRVTATTGWLWDWEGCRRDSESRAWS